MYCCCMIIFGERTEDQSTEEFPICINFGTESLLSSICEIEFVRSELRFFGDRRANPSHHVTVAMFICRECLRLGSESICKRNGPYELSIFVYFTQVRFEFVVSGGKGLCCAAPSKRCGNFTTAEAPLEVYIPRLVYPQTITVFVGFSCCCGTPLPGSAGIELGHNSIISTH